MDASGGRRCQHLSWCCCGCTRCERLGARYGQYLVQRGLVGDEVKLDEPLACQSQFLSTEVQARRQCGATVVAQALRVGHGDEKQVQRGASVIAAVDEVVLHQGLVNPTELLWSFAYAIRAKH